MQCVNLLIHRNLYMKTETWKVEQNSKFELLLAEMGKITNFDNLEDQDHFKQVILKITFQNQDHFYPELLFEAS